jgi:hypothetical protein
MGYRQDGNQNGGGLAGFKGLISIIANFTLLMLSKKTVLYRSHAPRGNDHAWERSVTENGIEAYYVILGAS